MQSSLGSSAELVFGDADRLMQVASNVLSNAVKFTPQGGTILVWLCRSVSQLDFIVTDTGEGIEPEFLAHVFETVKQLEPVEVTQLLLAWSAVDEQALKQLTPLVYRELHRPGVPPHGR